MASDVVPHVLSTKEAWTYCGGRPNFEALLAAAPEILQPWRRTESQGKTYYMVEVIDRALRAVQLSRELVKS